MKEFIYPVKIVNSSVGVQNASALFNISYPQIGLNEPKLCSMPSGTNIVLDFGKEYVGGIRILAHGGSDKVRIRVGESVSEACAELGEDGACNDHSLRDITVPIPSYSDNEYFKSGFRFVRIDNFGEDTLTLKKVLLCFNHAGLEQIGSFCCNDERVNEIFKIATRTVYMNIQNDVIYDGIKRDRLVWVGDLHPEFLAYLGLYGDYKYLKNSLKFSMEQTTPPAWMNNIPSYSMWFLIVMNEYVRHSGDVQFLKSHIDYVISTAESVSESVDERGELKLDFIFLDWPSSNYKDKGFAGDVALFYMAMKATVNMLALCNKDFEFAEKKAELVKNRYPDGCDYKQGAALRLYAGLKQNADVLCVKGVKGFSTFMSYYILKGIADEFGTAKATGMMKEYYGGMLDLGATTFFEDFDIDWLKNASRIDCVEEGKIDVHRTYGEFCYEGFRHSFCHGWSAGPVQYLQREVAGIKLEGIGCKTVSVKPRLGDLEWLKAEFPTPYGVIKVEADKSGVKVDAPSEITVIK